MTPEKIDYMAILNDMKAKRATLDASIVAFEAALASGMLGQGVEGISSGLGVTNANTTPIDLPKGAFLGKNMGEAITMYLTAMRQRKTVKDIAAGLLEGGLVSTSPKFEGVVQAKLQKMKADGQVLKFSDGWGLAEWSPASFRSTGKNPGKPVKAAKPARKKGKPKAKPAKEASTKQSGKPTVEASSAEAQTSQNSQAA